MIRPEDEARINRMTVALRLSRDSSCILLVSFNDELLRRDVEAELRRRLESEGFSFREFRATGDGYRNLPAVLVDMKPQRDDIFLIYDLRKILPEVLEYLNYRREDFTEHKISAIFWLDEPTLTEIARKAPDFWAFRSLPALEFKADRLQDAELRAQAKFSGELIYSTRGELEDMVALREELLKDYLQNRPQNRSTMARLHNELAQLYFGKAQFDRAMGSIQKALELYRKMEDRKGEANALNGLGMVLQELGDLEGAKEHFQRALKIDEGVYGPDHPNVARDLNNLGSALRTLGNLEGAKEHFQRALKIDEGVYGPDHPDVAIYVNNLGLVLHDLGDLEGAKENYERVLRIDEAVYGPDHPRMAIYVNNLGLVLHDLGDLEGAKENYERALKIDEGVYGPDHPSVAIRVNNLGRVLQALGDLEGAKENLQRALKIDEGVYGPEHLSVAMDVNNLGSVLEDLGDLEGAKENYKRALGILDRRLGADHPKTQLVRQNLQSLLDSQTSKAPVE
jgi:tetratricopeptide (TPR) repeat protein